MTTHENDVPDGRMRGCTWPACSASYDAATGPRDRGWKSTHHMSVLLCPAHSDTEHWPTFMRETAQMPVLDVRCGCGETARVTPPNWDSILRWWAAHVVQQDRAASL